MILPMILLIASYVGSVLFYPSLPQQVPSHWNIQGNVDDTMSKPVAAIFFPAMITFLFLMFEILPHIDPKKEKYHHFAKELKILKVTLLGFFVYLQYVIFYISSHPGMNFLPYMFLGLGFLFILLGNYLSKIRQNYFIGIRTPWTLSDEENWNKTHRLASWCFVGAGLFTIFTGIFFRFAPGFIFAGFMSAAFIPVLYSFLLSRKKGGYIRIVIIMLVVFALIIGGIRLASGEDN